MYTYIARRLITGIVSMFAVCTLAFFLLFYSAPNVGRTILGPDATVAQVKEYESSLGLDRPLIIRYIEWLSNAFRGDFGTSWFNEQPVIGSIVGRLPTTVAIVAVTILVTAVLATLVGVIAAVQRGWVDRLLQVLAIGGSAIPQFVMAVVLVTLFAIYLGWFPATGYVRPTDSVSGWLMTLILPVAALAISDISSTAQQVRSATIGVLEKEYVRTLRSRGLGFREILFRHVLRDAAPAGFTILSLQFIGMLGGVVVIEQIFAIPGIGPLALRATAQGDMPLLMGVVVYVVLVVVIVNLLVDIIVGWLNPKARVA